MQLLRSAVGTMAEEASPGCPLPRLSWARATAWGLGLCILVAITISLTCHQQPQEAPVVSGGARTPNPETADGWGCRGAGVRDSLDGDLATECGYNFRKKERGGEKKGQRGTEKERVKDKGRKKEKERW